jgi:ketosteroid isomerase-like protein
MRPKVFVVLFVALFVFGGVVKSQAESTTAPFLEESEALDIAKKWADLVGQADVVELEKLLSDKYLHIHATALVESKAQFLEAFKNGTRKYDPITLEELRFRGFGSFAIVTGKFQLKAFSRGKTIEGVNRFGLVLIKTQKGHEVVSFQATSIPQQK